MDNKRIHCAIKGSLIADAHALGSHWIYDEHQLHSLPIDWEELNPPHALWHKGKIKGDFTHYGDHTMWLYDFIIQNRSFSIEKYREYWCQKMKTYGGYIDGSSRDTLSCLDANPFSVHGATSHDLSIIGRIAPLLLISLNKKEFLTHVNELVSFTHNYSLVKDAAQFFGALLFDVVGGKNLMDAFTSTPVPDSLTERYQKALLSKGKTSFETIRSFGPACSIEGGFESVIHILITYDNYREAILANAKAGGDNAARGMIIGMLLGGEGHGIPILWEKSLNHTIENTVLIHG